MTGGRRECVLRRLPATWADLIGLLLLASSFVGRRRWRSATFMGWHCLAEYALLWAGDVWSRQVLPPPGHQIWAPGSRSVGLS
jgi:hypothetical protein